MTPAQDLISLRALSYLLRVDTTTLRRWIERGQLLPDQHSTAGTHGYFFQRARVDAIRQQLVMPEQPMQGSEWRQEFLDFARSRNLTKSYKPVLIKALLKMVNRHGEVPMSRLVHEFRNYYIQRQQQGLTAEVGVPLLLHPEQASDAQIRQLIIKNPLERFLIKGFLEYDPDDDIIRFAPALWRDLRFYELIEVLNAADEQLTVYYARFS